MNDSRLAFLLGDSPAIRTSAHGFLDDVTWDSGVFTVRGWMLPTDPRDDTQLEVRCDDVPLGHVMRVERADVAAAFPRLIGARSSGFCGDVAAPRGDPGAWRRLEVIARRDGRDVATLGTLFRADFATLVPDPTESLMMRVVQASARRAFRLDGLRTSREFLAALRSKRPHGDIARLLDFGCGCGRLLAGLPFLLDHTEIHGCDVDGEAVSYCAENIPRVIAAPNQFEPPSRYSPEMFDAIFAYSVFTHLDRDLQAAWLAEFARILARGGILILTLHGEYAAAVHGDRAFRTRLACDGIIDDLPDPALDAVLPKGVYRAVLQTEAWTRAVLSRVPGLALLDYIPRGASGYQDLVVLEKKQG